MVIGRRRADLIFVKRQTAIDAIESVGGDADARAGAAPENHFGALVTLPTVEGAADEIRKIVGWLQGVRADVDDVVTGRHQLLDDVLFALETTMVGGDNDFTHAG